MWETFRRRYMSRDDAVAAQKRFRSSSIQTGTGECGFTLRKDHTENASTVSSLGKSAVVARLRQWRTVNPNYG